MFIVPLPDWECCDGEVVMTACNWLIVEGVYCSGPSDPCPVDDSGSGSGSDSSGGGGGGEEPVI